MNQLITGNVFDNPEILDFYSVDQSALKITPRFVALPESTADLERLMKFFDQLSLRNVHVPIAIRGSGLDEMGADLTTGVVISTEKLNHLKEIDIRERLVRVEAGITLKELNTALSVSGLTIPIGANENETIGGLISNCPTDEYASKYGGIMNFVERIEVVLSNGDRVQTGRINKYAVAKKTADKTREAEIYRKIYTLTHEQEKLLNNLKAQNTNSAGYSTVAYVNRKDTLDLLPLFFTAEGSLGIISEVILRAVPIKKSSLRIIATFPKLTTALKFLDFANGLKPKALNIFDLSILKIAETSGKNLSKITRALEEGFIISATFDEKIPIIARRLSQISKSLPRSSKLILEDKTNIPIFDEFSNALANFLNLDRDGKRFPLLTNFYIPSTNLPQFIEQLTDLQKELKLSLPFFGSYSTSNYQLRPKFNSHEPDFATQLTDFIKKGSELIKNNGGSLTGGYPEGRVKAIITNHDLTDEEKKLYTEIKQIFDPNNILNPDIKLGADARFTLKHFQTTKSPRVVI